MLSDLVGSNPPLDARAVSLAVRDFLRVRNDSAGSYGICVAVSGGADSLALAVAAGDVADRLGIPYTVCIVDHRMRAGSSLEAAGVSAYLRTLGVPDVRILSTADKSATLPPSPEASARKLRHELLEEAARSFGAERDLDCVDILLGHTMDDQAETVLMRLGRGSGALALSAMAPLAPVATGGGPALNRGRPMLGVRRADTERFCHALGLSYLEDSTNAPDGPWQTRDGAPLPRAAIRAFVLPALEDALGQDPVPALARTAQLLREDSVALTQWSQAVLAEALTEEAGVTGLRIELLEGLPRAIAGRVLKAWAERCGATGLSLVHISELQKLIGSPRNAAGELRVVRLPGGVTALRVGALLTGQKTGEAAQV